MTIIKDIKQCESQVENEVFFLEFVFVMPEMSGTFMSNPNETFKLIYIMGGNRGLQTAAQEGGRADCRANISPENCPPIRRK